jgi:oligopeptidase A
MTSVSTENNPFLDQKGLPKFESLVASQLTPAVTYLLEKLESDFSTLEAALSSADGNYNAILPEVERMQFGLGYAWGVAGHLKGVKDSEELRAAYEENQPKVVTAFTKLSQSRPLFDALSEIKIEGEDYLQKQQKRAVDNQIKGMKLGGVGLDGVEKDRFNEIKLRLAELSTAFGNNVLDATKAFSLDITDSKDMKGVPLSAKSMWAAAYNRSKSKDSEDASPDDGPWRITLDGPSYLACMKHVPNRDVREKIYRAYSTRASEFTAPGEDQKGNNVPLIIEILKLKQDRAKLLGFNTIAEQSIASKMAPSVEKVMELLDLILAKALPAAENELAEITKLANQEGKLMPWDITFWNERLKESKFDLEEEALRPYFALPSVLEGMFGLIERLFSCQVKAADGEAEIWHPDVQFFKIYDKASGQHIASFFLDPYSRPENKRGGAWMNDCIGKSDATDRDVPVAYLTCNGSPPVGDTPSLMTFRECETLFHETGKNSVPIM